MLSLYVAASLVACFVVGAVILAIDAALSH